MSKKVSGYQKFFQDARRNTGDGKSMTPEQQVLRELAQRANSEKRQKRTSRRPPPRLALVLLGVSLLAGAVGIFSPNALESLGAINIGFLEGAIASDKAEKSAAAAPSAEHKLPATPDASSTKTADANPDLKQWTQEEMSFFKRLNDRKLELDRREAELAKLEEELQKQRVGIEEKIKQLEKTRSEISATLKDRVEQDQEKVAKLVDVYSSMKPQSASKVIESLNEDLAVTILDRMKKKNAAEILNTMAAAKAKKLSEMMTGYRQPASQVKSEE